MATIPHDLRGAVAAELARLVAGEVPDQLVWVRSYGATGARLIDQPSEVWGHARSDALRQDSGGWSVVVPLWTEDEAPSDLSAEIHVDKFGVATIRDVRAL